MVHHQTTSALDASVHRK